MQRRSIACSRITHRGCPSSTDHVGTHLESQLPCVSQSIAAVPMPRSLTGEQAGRRGRWNCTPGNRIPGLQWVADGRVPAGRPWTSVPADRVTCSLTNWAFVPIVKRLAYSYSCCQKWGKSRDREGCYSGRWLWKVLRPRPSPVTPCSTERAMPSRMAMAMEATPKSRVKMVKT